MLEMKPSVLVERRRTLLALCKIDDASTPGAVNYSKAAGGSFCVLIMLQILRSDSECFGRMAPQPKQQIIEATQNSKWYLVRLCHHYQTDFINIDNQNRSLKTQVVGVGTSKT